MSVITEWGHAFQNVTKEADYLRTQYDAETNPEKRQKILKRLLDITDTRLFCVVVSGEEGTICVRHIFRVSDDAKEHLDELKAEYYTDYEQLPTDEFFFFTGYHRAEAFARHKQGLDKKEG